MSEAKLVETLAADPEDLETYRVLADTLEARGDPRGPWIALQVAHASESDPAAQRRLQAEVVAYRDANIELLLGALAPWWRDRRWSQHWRWRHGFLERIDLAPPHASMADIGRFLAAVAATPAATLVRELVLQVSHSTQTVVDLVATHVPATLRRLDIVGAHPVTIGKLVARHPRLAHLHFDSHYYLPGDLVEVPGVRIAGFVGGAVAAALARWPALETLSLRADHPLASVTLVMRILESADLPRVTTLALPGCTFANEVVAGLASTRVGRQLRSVDCTRSQLDDDGVRAWLAHPPPAKLERITVQWSQVTAAGRAALAAIADRVIGEGAP